MDKIKYYNFILEDKYDINLNVNSGNDIKIFKIVHYN